MAQHEHTWVVDYSLPTSDVLPVHRAVKCKCGATACQEDETSAVHEVKEPRLSARREGLVPMVEGGDG